VTSHHIRHSLIGMYWIAYCYHVHWPLATQSGYVTLEWEVQRLGKSASHM